MLAHDPGISDLPSDMISAINNSSALGALFRLSSNQRSLNTSLERLATGRRINSGKDDPAGLIASERLSAEIKALEAQSRSFERTYSNANIADGYTSQLSGLASELKGLAVASANSGALSSEEVAAYQLQADNIVASIERFTGSAITSLEGVSLPDDGNAQVQAQLEAARASAQSVRSGGANDFRSGNFEAAITAIDSAISDITTSRGTIGAYQKYTLEPQLRSNEVALVNLSESRSRIADTDYATETSNLARAEVLTAASVKLLKIAQNQTGTILDLFG